MRLTVLLIFNLWLVSASAHVDSSGTPRARSYSANSQSMAMALELVQSYNLWNSIAVKIEDSIPRPQVPNYGRELFEWRRFAIQKLGELGIVSDSVNEILLYIVKNERDNVAKILALEALSALRSSDQQVIDYVWKKIKSLERNLNLRRTKDLRDELELYLTHFAKMQLDKADHIEAVYNFLIGNWNFLSDPMRLSFIEGLFLNRAQHPEIYQKLIESCRENDDMASYLGLFNFKVESNYYFGIIHGTFAAFRFTDHADSDLRLQAKVILRYIRDHIQQYETTLIELIEHRDERIWKQAVAELRRFNPEEPLGLNRISRRILTDNPIVYRERFNPTSLSQGSSNCSTLLDPKVEL